MLATIEVFDEPASINENLKPLKQQNVHVLETFIFLVMEYFVHIRGTLFSGHSETSSYIKKKIH